MELVAVVGRSRGRADDPHGIRHEAPRLADRTGF
jgi:hypothetical protein